MIQEKKTELLENLEKAETMDEVKSIEAEIEQVEEHEKLAKEKAAIMDSFKASEPVTNERSEAKTLGEFASKNLDFEAIKGNPRGSSATPYFKGTQTFTGQSATDATMSRTIPAYKSATPFIDAVGSEQIDGNAYEWVVMGAFDLASADTTEVAEGAKKPEIATNYGKATASLKTYAGWFKETEQMLEDNAYLATAINDRGLRYFDTMREATMMTEFVTAMTNGVTVTGPNAPTLPIKPTYQTFAMTQATTAAEIADAIFKAIAEVKKNTGVDPDSVVIPSTVANILRTGRDENGQYYGGGYFMGAYGNGGFDMMPKLWGLNVIVNDYADDYLAIVGNFKLGAAYITKRGGGVRVNVVNTNEDDFIHNLVTVRIEERGLLAVRDPKLFVPIQITEG